MGTRKGTSKGSERAPRRVWAKAFLSALEQTGKVVDACAAAGVAHRTVYKRRANHKDFAAAWDRALDRAADHLEREAIRRALDGWDEPVFHNGEQCGVKRKYSDTLLIFLLKGIRPAKFRDNYDESQSTGPVVFRDVDW